MKKIKINRKDLTDILEIARFYTHWNDKTSDRRDFNKVCKFEIKYKISHLEAIRT